MLCSFDCYNTIICSSLGRASRPSLHVIEITELQKEYSLVLARLKLVQHVPDFIAGDSKTNTAV